MKLRSYPDTTEAKQRKVGMYKSPASSVRKSKSVMSRKESPIPRKAPVEKTKGMNVKDYKFTFT